ncbi:hypothetical protein [Anabaenopsis arnoldii]|uniref:Maturase K n=1 Tax=Anabaenopsis arnoldii TaxID=2152938 RepID=A0ABT5ASD0_9CYAN|nr:hypothetical protein [Anabaenopsis arnoldii]MDB9540190.1 hypothetical protein [Anabaenopsis arnoldii]MDH6092587.1 hypothetical protein [Anabaenopsis arnoldii]
MVDRRLGGFFCLSTLIIWLLQLKHTDQILAVVELGKYKPYNLHSGGWRSPSEFMSIILSNFSWSNHGVLLNLYRLMLPIIRLFDKNIAVSRKLSGFSSESLNGALQING